MQYKIKIIPSWYNKAMNSSSISKDDKEKIVAGWKKVCLNRINSKMFENRQNEELLFFSFEWAKTEEGYDFWSKIEDIIGI